MEHLNCSKKKPPQFLIYDYGAPDDASPVIVVSDNGIPFPSQGDNFQRFGAITNLLSSVDGLFFLKIEIDNGIDKSVLCSLWNPAAREVRHLPASPIEFEPFDVYDEKPTWRILSFDFGKEVFVEIEGPPNDYCIYNWSVNLILLDDSVAILNFVESALSKLLDRALLYIYTMMITPVIESLTLQPVGLLD
ncbi:hypothetical protein BC332_27648 [Capsicum chinense]|nr:hypothetical protein BC332_27648 [Capsicum chinense]